MTRREFLTASAAASLLPARSIAQQRKPNIIFILADDLGYGDLGCYGQKRIETSNIDRIAAEGVRFTDGYAGSTVCAPSRSCLMTGTHTGHTRIRGNSSPTGRVALRPEDTTIAEILKKAGYQTGLFGKWGLGEANTTGRPTQKGFDEFFGYLNQTHAHSYYPDHLWHNDEQVFLPGNLAGGKREYSHDLIAEQALDFVRRSKDQPFFLYLALTTPHANNEAGRFLGDGMEVPDYGRYAGENWPTTEKGFAAMITRMDRDIGRLMALLKELGLDVNTVVLFSSDNGPHHEGNHDPEFFGSRGGLRGIKRDLYEGGIRVPAMARWPGKIQPGGVSSQVWAFWDVLPTLAEIAGAQAPAGLDGISMLPALLGKPQKHHVYLYWEFFERGFHQAVRQGEWKAVRHGLDAPIELYDLKQDQTESSDVAGDHRDIVLRMREILESARTESKEFPIPMRAMADGRRGSGPVLS
jgi:arylsulfatase A-like enzyme